MGKRLRAGDDPLQLPTDSVPGGDFRYVCLGYGAYDEDGLKTAARRRSSQAEPVQLPYCEGLEVVSAAAMSSKPELLTGGPPLGPPPATARPPHDKDQASIRQRPGRTLSECYLSRDVQFPVHWEGTVPSDTFVCVLPRSAPWMALQRPARPSCPAAWTGTSLETGLTAYLGAWWRRWGPTLASWRPL